VGVTRIVLHVDTLVLRGFHRGDRAAIAASLGAELARALGGPDGASRLARRRDVDRVHVPVLRVPAAATPARVARLVARGIGQGLRS
jgi:hypothetical protein